MLPVKTKQTVHDIKREYRVWEACRWFPSPDWNAIACSPFNVQAHNCWAG